MLKVRVNGAFILKKRGKTQKIEGKITIQHQNNGKNANFLLIIMEICIGTLYIFLWLYNLYSDLEVTLTQLDNLYANLVFYFHYFYNSIGG